MLDAFYSTRPACPYTISSFSIRVETHTDSAKHLPIEILSVEPYQCDVCGGGAKVHRQQHPVRGDEEARGRVRRHRDVDGLVLEAGVQHRDAHHVGDIADGNCPLNFMLRGGRTAENCKKQRDVHSAQNRVG